MGIIVDLEKESVVVDYNKKAEKKLHIVVGSFSFINQAMINMAKDLEQKVEKGIVVRSRIKNSSYDFPTIVKQRFDNGFLSNDYIIPTVLQIYSFKNVIQKNNGALFIEELVQRRFFSENEKHTMLYIEFENRKPSESLLSFGWSLSFVNFLLDNSIRRCDSETLKFLQSKTVT